MDYFSDDEFEDLNDNVLQELENNAIQFTQAQRLAQSQVAPHDQHAALGYSFVDDDLDDSVVLDELAQPPPQPPSLAGQQPRNQQSQQMIAIHAARPQYPTPSRPAPPPLPPQRGPPWPYHPQPRPPHSESQFVRPPLPIARPYALQSSEAIQPTVAAKQNELITQLQAQLAALETELTAARGEAALMRSRCVKAQALHDAEVARLKKQAAEQIAKQQRAVEAALAAEKATATALKFARQDLKEELGRAKTKKKDGPATPKKQKDRAMADGFDGVELMPSPSKGQAQKRKDHRPAAIPFGEGSPGKGKRKRPIVDSPIFALETHSEDVPNLDTAAEAPTPAAGSLFRHRMPFNFLKLVLAHSPPQEESLTFDLLSRFAFPSQPSHTLASIIFKKFPMMGTLQEPLTLLTDFAESMIDMWQQCLSEKYHAPIYYLAALVLYTLEFNTVDVAPHILSSLVPVCTTTCSLVARPRFSSADGDLSDHPDGGVRQLYLDIDVTQSLSLLYLTALGCALPTVRDSDEPLPLESSPDVLFWKTMDLEFVFLMLSPTQPEPDWFKMLSLLRTSVFHDSIGPIPDPVSATTYYDFGNGRSEPLTRELVARGIIDRVAYYLTDLPRWAPRDSEKEVLVRLEALKALKTFAVSEFGLLQIAQNDGAISQLVLGLSWAVDRLYDMDDIPSIRKPMPDLADPAESRVEQESKESGAQNLERQDPDSTQEMQLDGEPQPTAPDVEAQGSSRSRLVPGHNQQVYSLLCRVIAHATSFLHDLVTDPLTADSMNMPAKLAASRGGAQRYLLTLARLNFAEEDLVLESGIDAQTVDFAHELLELAVTPEEAKQISQAFGAS
ncbi:hypothetical protein QBC46DRAFT_272080 [Diplogelasinospora grovesii]|uniref:DNA repair protein Rad26 n=1 Tax=Diplogelasinospora grovesii TaxID=303347 RepID=A0AAN6MXE7_9PEZI|nr:hypothetical protein QBC46DRAFT_272080 [Diplogelasinospora grovesii]